MPWLMELKISASEALFVFPGQAPVRFQQLSDGYRSMLAMGIDSMLFAIDWPYESNTVGMEFFNKLSLSDADKHKLAHGNAEKLLGV